MSKLALFRTTIRSTLAVRTTGFAAHGRGFSTDSESPPQQPQDSSSQSQSSETPTSRGNEVPSDIYLRLYGVSKNTLRTDIANVLEGCNVTQDDIKVEYDNRFFPKSMLVKLASSQLMNQVYKMIGKKGRLYRTEKVAQSQWDTLAPYEGKVVLVQGIPLMALLSDVERFLSGCNYYNDSVRMINRNEAAAKMAMVRFPSQYEAMNCVIAKNKTFCLNNQVQLRVLQ